MSVVFLYSLVLLQWSAFDGHSTIADYFFRRLYAVQAQLIGYFIDFLFLTDKRFPDWNWWTGSNEGNSKIAYFIGGFYLDSIEINANTNSFLYAFAANGILGYLFSMVFVSVILVLFDRLYYSSRNPSYIFLGFIYGLLIVEQAYTTAFISSGVCVLLLLTMMEYT